MCDVSFSYEWVCVTYETHSYECYPSNEWCALYMNSNASKCVTWCCRRVICCVHMSAMCRVHMSAAYTRDIRDIWVYHMRDISHIIWGTWHRDISGRDIGIYHIDMWYEGYTWPHMICDMRDLRDIWDAFICVLSITWEIRVIYEKRCI